jgi:hypothetical protein
MRSAGWLQSVCGYPAVRNPVCNIGSLLACKSLSHKRGAMNSKIQSSHWYQIGVKYALGTSPAREIPPNEDRFWMGVFSVIQDQPEHKLWTEVGMRVRRGEKLPLPSPQTESRLYWEAIAKSAAIMGSEDVFAKSRRSDHVGFDEGVMTTRPMSHIYLGLPDMPEQEAQMGGKARSVYA